MFSSLVPKLLEVIRQLIAVDQVVFSLLVLLVVSVSMALALVAVALLCFDAISLVIDNKRRVKKHSVCVLKPRVKQSCFKTCRTAAFTK